MPSLLDIQFNVDQIVKDYGPTVWQAAQRQVMVNLIGDLFWGTFGLVVVGVAIIVGFRLMKRLKARDDDPDLDDLLFGCWFFPGLAIVLGGAIAGRPSCRVAIGLTLFSPFLTVSRSSKDCCSLEPTVAFAIAQTWTEEEIERWKRVWGDRHARPLTFKNGDVEV